MSLCRICSTPVAFFARKNAFDVLRCPKCGFGQVDVSPAVLDSFYDKEYFNGEKAGFAQQLNEPISSARRFWINNQLSEFPRGKPLQVLEIGPGLGGPVSEYFTTERPADSYAAVEFSEYAAAQLKARGFQVWTGRVVEKEILQACRGRYDFVFGTEVIEHDLEPMAFLSAVHDMLRPGGRAAFTTGNLDGRMAQKHKADWYYLDPPAHVSYYTPRSAEKAMSDVGFSNFRVTRYGFRHIEALEKYPDVIRDALLWMTDVTNVSTGMTISAERA